MSMDLEVRESTNVDRKRDWLRLGVVAGIGVLVVGATIVEVALGADTAVIEGTLGGGAVAMIAAGVVVDRQHEQEEQAPTDETYRPR